MAGELDDLVWMGSTQSDLAEALKSVRITMGGAIRTAQQGGKSSYATPMQGDLRDVMEVRDDDEAGTYRLMYTTKIGDKIFVLDFFQKKSKSGVATPQSDLNRIRLRLKKHVRYMQPKSNDDEDVTFTRSSGNVFADLGLESADELLVKADLAHAINAEIQRHAWTQNVAAERTGLTQPEVSLLGRMKTERFSQERLQTVLRRLGMDVEITIQHREGGGIGTLTVRELV